MLIKYSLISDRELTRHCLFFIEELSHRHVNSHDHPCFCVKFVEATLDSIIDSIVWESSSDNDDVIEELRKILDDLMPAIASLAHTKKLVDKICNKLQEQNIPLEKIEACIYAMSCVTVHNDKTYFFYDLYKDPDLL